MTSLADEASLARAAGRRIPDFFIVGHAKCGTTALYEMLRRHPEVYMPEVKEPWFFARDNPNPQLTSERRVEWTGRRVETLDEYLALFERAAPGQIAGEASTSYIWSAAAPGRIAEVRPDAKLIVLIREPAAYLRSMHLQLLENHVETEKDFRRAMALDEPRRQGRMVPSYSYWPQTLIYSDRVRYAEQLSRYEQHFPAEQILVIIYDDFRNENEATVRRVRGFLGIDDTLPVELMEANPTRDVRSVRLDSLVRSVKAGRGPVSGAAKRTIKTLAPAEVRRRVIYPLRRRTVYAKPKPVDEAFMRELRRRFAGEVQALSDHLGRDLAALWGYDRLG